MYRKLLPMKFRTIVGLLIVMIVCSCIQQPSKNRQQIEDGANQQPLMTSSQKTGQFKIREFG